MNVGILALQGGVQEHCDVLKKLGVQSSEVRDVRDLQELTHLIIPGGESTVMGRFLTLFGLREAIVSRAGSGTLAIFGTCAGAILLSTKIEGDHNPEPLKLMDMTIDRNAYGTQLDSFDTELGVSGITTPVQVSFIRAPIIRKYSRNVEILAESGGNPVVVRQGRMLASTCHPELRGETALHRLFLSM